MSTYTYENQAYQSGNAISKTKKTQHLQLGDVMTIIVDPANPKRAFVQELYL